MAALVSFSQAKDHLRITTNDADPDVHLKMEQASAIVLDRCNTTEWWRAITPTWTETTVPGAVQAAILLVLTHLHENRGDDMKADAMLWAAVDNYIRLHKDPVIA